MAALPQGRLAQAESPQRGVVAVPLIERCGGGREEAGGRIGLDCGGEWGGGESRREAGRRVIEWSMVCWLLEQGHGRAGTLKRREGTKQKIQSTVRPFPFLSFLPFLLCVLQHGPPVVGYKSFGRGSATRRACFLAIPLLKAPLSVCRSIHHHAACSIDRRMARPRLIQSSCLCVSIDSVGWLCNFGTGWCVLCRRRLSIMHRIAYAPIPSINHHPNTATGNAEG